MNEHGAKVSDHDKDVVYFEDLEQLYGHKQKEQYTGCLVTMVAVGFIAASGIFAALGNPLVAPICVGIGALVLLSATVYQKLRTPRRPKLFCPNCARELDAIRRQALLTSRACPVCLYVFPSRSLPQLRKIAFDRAKLPRIWLQGEAQVSVMAEVVDEVPPISADATLNPYVAPQPVADASAAQTSFAQAVKALVCAWYNANVSPARTLLQSNEQLLAQPGLIVFRDPPTARGLRIRAAYLLASRRQAWLQILFFTVWPVIATALVAWWLAYRSEVLWLSIVLAVMTHWFATMLGLIGFAQLLASAPRWLKNWLNGELSVMDAETDPDTGYYGIRLRLMDVFQQHDLPSLGFRFRQNKPGEMLLRLVNQEQACGWELPLPYNTPGEWQAAQVDLRALIRQSAPDFFGNEVHFVSDPDSELEITDYQFVGRA